MLKRSAGIIGCFLAFFYLSSGKVSLHFFSPGLANRMAGNARVESSLTSSNALKCVKICGVYADILYGEEIDACFFSLFFASRFFRQLPAVILKFCAITNTRALAFFGFFFSSCSTEANS